MTSLRPPTPPRRQVVEVTFSAQPKCSIAGYSSSSSRRSQAQWPSRNTSGRYGTARGKHTVTINALGRANLEGRAARYIGLPVSSDVCSMDRYRPLCPMLHSPPSTFAPSLPELIYHPRRVPHPSGPIDPQPSPP